MKRIKEDYSSNTTLKAGNNNYLKEYDFQYFKRNSLLLR